MVRHAGGAVYDTHIFNGAAASRRLVENVSYLRESGRLEAVEAGNGLKKGEENEWFSPRQDTAWGESFRHRKSLLFLCVAEASVG
jgi:hypothetical protein